MEKWEPRSTLLTKEHLVPRSRFPSVDVHSHHRSSTSAERLDQIFREMDALNLSVLVNLSGGCGDRLRTAASNVRGRHPDRFAVFANPDF